MVEAEQIHYEFDESPDAQGAVAQSQLGKTIDVPPSVDTKGGWQTVIYTPESPVPVDWEFVLRPNADTSGTLYFRVTYTLGGQSFTKKPRLMGPTGCQQRFHVTGRRVQVDVLNGPNIATGAQASDVSVSGGAGLARVDSDFDWYLSSWLNQTTGFPSTDLTSTPAIVDSGPGVLLAYQALLGTMTGDANAYVVFLDVGAAGPVGAEKALWSTPAFTAAPQWASFADASDARLQYKNGLWMAFSSTSRVYTASTGSGEATMFHKVGC